MAEEQDIRDLMRAERSRGTRKPTQLSSLKQQRDLAQMCRDLLRPEATEQDLEGVMRALGVERRTERYAAALKAWRAERRF